MPFGVLFLPEPPQEELTIPDMRTMENLVIEEPSANLLDMVALCRSRQDWYREYARDLGIKPPSFVGSATTSHQPRDVAQDILEVTGWNELRHLTRDQAFSELIRRVEDLGVLVMVSGVVGSNTRRNLNPEEFRGFTLVDNLVPLIFINGEDSRTAQIFTLLHELAHVWLGHSTHSGASNSPLHHGTTEERWCNQVAAEVLLPLEAVEKLRATDLDDKTLLDMADRHHVSVLMLLTRLRAAQLLTKDDYEERASAERRRIKDLMHSPRKRSGGGNFYNTGLRRMGRPFTRAVIASTLEGRTSYRDAYALLGTKSHAVFQGFVERVGVS